MSEPKTAEVKVALKGLTRTERETVKAGYICDQRMSTVNSLKRKGLFYLKIDSPNGRCGSMELTPLGVGVQALIAEEGARQ